MIRTQVQLTETQHRLLKRAAADRGVSVAELVRRCIDRALEDEAPSRAELYDRATRLAGAFPDLDGATNVAEDHDQYLEDAFS